MAGGAIGRIGHLGQQHLPGEEVWLVDAHRAMGERKWHLGPLPGVTP